MGNNTTRCTAPWHCSSNRWSVVSAGCRSGELHHNTDATPERVGSCQLITIEANSRADPAGVHCSALAIVAMGNSGECTSVSF